MKVRRVVTGHNERGKAVFVSDEQVTPITVSLMPATEFHQLWGGDEAPRFPDRGLRPVARSYFPPLGGFRFGVVTIPPENISGTGSPVDGDVAAAIGELEGKLPGLLQYMERDAPGMHTTPTVDFEVVLVGELVLELDDGATVTLQAGDTVVQNGTRHRWRNVGSVPATFAFFICGANHAKFLEPRATT